MSGEYSVYQFFADNVGTECVKQFIDIETAMRTAKSLTQSVGAKLGLTQRVIITDGGDCIVMEWEFGKGLVYPTKEMIEENRAQRKNNPPDAP